MLRPSCNTSNLLAKTSLKPRALTAHWLESSRAASIPGTSRRASGMLKAPERRMSSSVMTEIAAGDCDSFSEWRATLVTSIPSRVSMGSSVKSGCAAEFWLRTGTANHIRVNASRKQFGFFACNRFEPVPKSESWDSAAHGFRSMCFITSANAADYQQVPCLETAETGFFRDNFENTGARDRGKISIHWLAALGHTITRDL